MELKILGCSGGKSIGHNPTSFLLDNFILIDAGTVINKVDPNQLIENIDHLILTHSHVDHISDLPFLAQLAFEDKNTSFTVHASGECTESVFDNIFNFRIWPDLFEISDTKNGNLKWKKYENLQTFTIMDYYIKPVFVNHTVPTYGLIIDDGKSSFGFTADTYLTDSFWEECNSKENISAIIVDVSFPSHMTDTAESTKHLTPDLLLGELEKLESKDIDIYVTHIKPQLEEEVKNELKDKFSGLNLYILSENLTINI